MSAVVGTKNCSMGSLRLVVTTVASSTTSGDDRLDGATAAQSPLSNTAWYLFSPFWA